MILINMLGILKLNEYIVNNKFSEMKKLGIVAVLLSIGLVVVLTQCRKPPIDPCENVVCEPYEKCVNGKCVPIRKGAD